MFGIFVWHLACATACVCALTSQNETIFQYNSGLIEEPEHGINDLNIVKNYLM